MSPKAYRVYVDWREAPFDLDFDLVSKPIYMADGVLVFKHSNSESVEVARFTQYLAVLEVY